MAGGVCVGKDLIQVKGEKKTTTKNESESRNELYALKAHSQNEHTLPEAHMLWVLWGLDGGMQRQILDM